MRICVVGLGAIGFNLFTHLVRKISGEVLGVDVDERKITELRQQGFKVTADYRELKEVDVWLMAPSTGNQGQKLFSALEQMIIRPGSLISIESTLPPGTMGRAREFLERKGFILGADIFLIHVPHRIMFGIDKTVCDTPRVMGAFTEGCLEKGRNFYAPLVPRLVEVSDVRVAELSKVVENVKRYVDIAFAQEIYSYCADQGLDYDELRRAVNSKNNVELLGTDWGIGGECLPKDMSFLRAVCKSKLLDGAEQADREYRQRVTRQVGSSGSVLVRGISYKAGVKDLRHSRGVELVRALEAAKNTVFVEDPLFTPEELSKAGFKTINKAYPENQAEKVARVVLDRQKALNIQ